jgi:transposase
LQEETELLKNGRNSKTGSTAPSQDINLSNAQSLRTGSGKKSGGQKGHPGHTLSVSERPDKIIEYFPERCICICICNLENVLISGHTCRQAVDIPPVKPEYTKHRSLRKECPECGKLNTDNYPEGVTSPIQYGSNVKSTVSYMPAYQYFPYKRMREFFKAMFSLPLSAGSIDSILEEMSQKTEVAYHTMPYRNGCSRAKLLVRMKQGVE